MIKLEKEYELFNPVYDYRDHTEPSGEVGIRERGRDTEDRTLPTEHAGELRIVSRTRYRDDGRSSSLASTNIW